jgi:hypothetical protein
MKLVDDAHTLWRRWSTRIAAFQVVTFVAFWALIPQDLRDAVPSWAKFGIVILLGLVFIIAQAISQPKLRDCKDEKKPDA